MTRKEAERLTHQQNTLRALGFTSEEAESLRRISMTLRRWHELECNGDVQRDESTGQTYYHYGHDTAGPFLTIKCPDREKGAHKRLAAILKARNERKYVMNSNYYGLRSNALDSYIQTDPRGAALYILRPGDVPEGADAGAYYNRGICVY